MKHILVISVLLMSNFTSCKSTKATSEASQTPAKQTTETTQDATTPKTMGKVSHQYRAAGCATVIIIKSDKNIITLIPKDKLPEKLDVDGLEISFEYRPLKMRNPDGCTVGFPAELTNIKSVK